MAGRVTGDASSDELLYTPYEGWAVARELADGGVEPLLARLDRRPALLRLPGSDPRRAGRFVATLLHGNEDSGVHALVRLFADPLDLPFDLWVFIGNVRAATAAGLFGHRYLDGQEDFNRVWGREPVTSRMRRCAAQVLRRLADVRLEAGLDLHNNTGRNPPYAIVPHPTPGNYAVAATCSERALVWGTQPFTLMDALNRWCPAVALESGIAGSADSAAYASESLHRFLAAPEFPVGRHPPETYQVVGRVVVRSEVVFRFGGDLDEYTELVLEPGLDRYNFGQLPAGTSVGRVDPGAPVPLDVVADEAGPEARDLFQVRADGHIVVTHDVVPAMMVTDAEQARRDCLFYVVHRLPRPDGAAGAPQRDAARPSNSDVSGRGLVTSE